jgi:hypothetical protein
VHFYDGNLAPRIGASTSTEDFPMTEQPRKRRRFWPFRPAAGALKCLPLLLLPFLTSCGGGGASSESPKAACEARANHDPAVEQLIMLDATRESLVGENREALQRARNAAVLRCLRDKGLAPPGGVELPVLHR